MVIQPMDLSRGEHPPKQASGTTQLEMRRWKMAAMAVLLIGISLGHYTTSLEIPIAHDVMDRLYYIPIGLAAFWFGLRGGITAGLASIILYIPHIIQWERSGHLHAHQAYGNKYVEAGLFPLFGLFIGYLLDTIRQKNRALGDAYARSVESYRAADRSARMAVLGQVAAGLAHEVRNPLAGLQGAVEALGDQVPAGNEIAREFRRRALGEISRLSTLVSDFVAIGKPSPIEPAPVDLAEVIRNVVSLLSAEAQEQNISIGIEIENAHLELMLDGNKIKQTIMNLILNAIQSMPDGGKIVVLVIRAERSVSIRVLDEGVGIPEEQREKIFSPFFTTKKQGAGLGLPLARQIVEAHGGKLTMEDGETGGTAFTITLPFEQDGDVHGG